MQLQFGDNSYSSSSINIDIPASGVTGTLLGKSYTIRHSLTKKATSQRIRYRGGSY